jgi:hypothetical protein
MKYREFMEHPRYSKILHHWIDMTFGKKQQSVEDQNIYFSYATPEYYEKTPDEEITRMALNSASEFYQLPRQLFTNNHRSLGNIEQTDNFEEAKSINQMEGVEEVTKEEIKVFKDEDIM